MFLEPDATLIGKPIKHFGVGKLKLGSLLCHTSNHRGSDAFWMRAAFATDLGHVTLFLRDGLASSLADATSGSQ